MTLIITKIGPGFYQVKPHKYSIFYANVHKRSASRKWGWTYDIRDNRCSTRVQFNSAAGSMKEVLEYLEDDFAERYGTIDEAAEKLDREIEESMKQLGIS